MIQFEARDQAPIWAMPAAVLAALGLTFAMTAALVAALGAPVSKTFQLIVEGAVGSRFALTETLTRATPLILTGLAVAVAFRAKLYNIGAEGQLYAGALAAVAVGGLHHGSGWDLPLPMLFAGMWLAAMSAGAVLLVIPAWLKTRLKVDEVVTTLLLNFVALLFVSMLLDGPMKDPAGMGWPQSVAINPELELTRILEPTRLHSGLLLAVGLACMIALMNRFTRLGFMMRNVGHNAAAAQFMGIPVTRVTLYTAMLSGAIAGLAGAVEVAGRAGYVTLDMATGYGYTGVVVAMLAALNPLGVIAASVLVAGVFVGADSMSRTVAVPSFIADVMVAIALLAMLVASFLTQYRFRRVRTH